MSVTLRALEPSDLAFLYQIENDRSLWPVTSTSAPYSRSVLEDFIANSTGNIYADGQLRLVIENADGERVGLLDLTDFSPQHRRAEVGIVIAANHRRRGYAFAALRELDDYAVGIIHLHQLFAIVPEENEASLALFAKNGFSTSQTLSDWLFDGKKYHDVRLMQKFF